MNNIIERIWKQGGLVNIEDLRGTAFQAEESAHTFRIRGVDESGEPLALTGTCAAIFLRADNTDVAITGTITDGAAEITLTDECYDMPGRFGLTIYVTSDEQTVAVYAAIGSVYRTSSGVVSPETGEDVTDLINAIAAAVDTIPASYTDLMAAVAPTYSTSALYAVGSYAWYDGKLYRCTTAITSGETWTSAHWTQANLGSDVSDLKSALRNPFVYPSSGSNTRNGVAIQTEGNMVKLNGTATDNTAFVLNSNNLRSGNGHTIELFDNDSTSKNIIPGKQYFLHRKLISGTVEKNGTTYTAANFPEFGGENIVNSFLLKRGSYNAGHYLKTDDEQYTAIIDDCEVGILDVYIYNGVIATDAVFEIWVEEVEMYSMGNETLNVIPYLALTSNGSISFVTANPNYPFYISQKIQIPDNVLDSKIRHNGSGNGDYAALAFYDANGDLISVSTNGAHTDATAQIPDGAKSFVLSSFTGDSSPIDDPENFYVKFLLSKDNACKYSTIEKKKTFFLYDLKEVANPIENAEVKTATGIIDSSDASNYTTTRLIKLPKNHLGIIGTYAYTSSSRGRVAFYDGNKDFISAVGSNSKRIINTEIPSGARYVRIGTHTTIPYENVKAYVLCPCEQETVDIEYLVDSKDFYQPATITANHRGYNTVAPENTLPAFKMSKQRGFSMIETDIRVTSDGVLVLLHDYSINRTARNVDGTEISGNVNISEITYEQALEYDFGIWMGSEYAGTKIPTLEEALILFNRIGLSAMLEIEATGNMNSKYVRDIVELVNNCGMRNRVIYTCFNKPFLDMVLDYDDEATVAISVSTTYTTETFPLSKFTSLQTGKNIVMAMINKSNLDDDVLKMLQKNGIQVNAWIIDTINAALLLNPYVTSFTSNVLNVTEALKEYYLN